MNNALNITINNKVTDLFTKFVKFWKCLGMTINGHKQWAAKNFHNEHDERFETIAKKERSTELCCLKNQKI